LNYHTHTNLSLRECLHYSMSPCCAPLVTDTGVLALAHLFLTSRNFPSFSRLRQFFRKRLEEQKKEREDMLAKMSSDLREKFLDQEAKVRGHLSSFVPVLRGH